MSKHKQCILAKNKTDNKIPKHRRHALAKDIDNIATINYTNNVPLIVIKSNTHIKYIKNIKGNLNIRNIRVNLNIKNKCKQKIRLQKIKLLLKLHKLIIFSLGFNRVVAIPNSFKKFKFTVCCHKIIIPNGIIYLHFSNEYYNLNKSLLIQNNVILTLPKTVVYFTAGDNALKDMILNKVSINHR